MYVIAQECQICWEQEIVIWQRKQWLTLKLSVLALILIFALFFGHNTWAGFFSDSPEIIKDFASFTPLLLISITFDSMQGVLLGVIRGCGWQHLAVFVNLATFYCIGTTISGILGFKFKLHVKGLSIGLICNLASQATTLLLIILCKKWTKMDIPKDGDQENQDETENSTVQTL